MQDDRLDGRHIIVTGGAQGIGRGIARRVARAGGTVSVFDLDPESAAETIEAVEAEGSAGTAFEVDVSDQTAVKEGVAAAIEAHGAIHGLVNNAGVQESVPILEADQEDFAFHFDVNVLGTFYCAQAVAEQMIDAGTEGAIVNIASTASERPFPGQGPYATSKAGVVTLGIVMAKELGEYGITVNTVNPGTVDTPMVQAFLEENAAQTDLTEEEILDDALSANIIERIGQPEEIGHVVTLLLSEEGEWMTGETINVDAGYTVG